MASLVDRVRRGTLAVSPSNSVFAFLGDPANSDSVAMAVNGSSTAVNFEYTATKTTVITRMGGVLVDGAITSATFGGATALTNGCTLKVIDTDGSTVLEDFLGGSVIKTTAQFGFLADSFLVYESSSGEDALLYRFDVEAALGYPLVLTTSQIVRFTVADDCSALTTWQTWVRGFQLA